MKGEYKRLGRWDLGAEPLPVKYGFEYPTGGMVASSYNIYLLYR